MLRSLDTVHSHFTRSVWVSIDCEFWLRFPSIRPLEWFFMVTALGPCVKRPPLISKASALDATSYGASVALSKARLLQTFLFFFFLFFLFGWGAHGTLPLPPHRHLLFFCSKFSVWCPNGQFKDPVHVGQSQGSQWVHHASQKGSVKKIEKTKQRGSLSKPFYGTRRPSLMVSSIFTLYGVGRWKRQFPCVQELVSFVFFII